VLPFIVRWEDSNTGTRATSAGWTDLLTIRNTSTGETLATVALPYDPAAAGNGSITPGGARARQYSYQLPNGTRGVGQLQVTVSIDSSQTIFENNAGGTAEANNTALLTRSSALAAYPDLQVSGLGIDGPAGVVSGGTVTVRWDDGNTGSGATTGAWTDLLVVKNTSTGETLISRALAYDPALAGNGNIAAADKRARQYSFQLPDGASGVGDLLLTVTADSGNALFENNPAGTAESNNVVSLSSASAAGAYPDLQVDRSDFRRGRRPAVGRRGDAALERRQQRRPANERFLERLRHRHQSVDRGNAGHRYRRLPGIGDR
jgi:hypothetical protein